MELQYSEISITGKLPVRKDNISEEDYKAWICVKALCDWACCIAGAQLPFNFGKGMVEVGKLLGVLPTPDSLREYSKSLLV